MNRRLLAFVPPLAAAALFAAVASALPDGDPATAPAGPPAVARAVAGPAGTPAVADAVAPSAPASGRGEAARGAQAPPVRILATRGFGKVLTRRDGQALYFWTRERDGKVRCTGRCAALWPPLYVANGVTVTPRVAGVKGRFGVVRRPDGRRQLTLDRMPLYTYAHEAPRQVLCDDVDGWFVVRTARSPRG